MYGVTVYGVPDPLQTPLDTWDEATLRQLLGRHESRRLELQGQIDPAKATYRRGVADEAAGMASAVGGFIVIGANDGDELTDLPGIDATEDDAQRLRNAMLDLVQPYVLLRGPRLFDSDTPPKKVLVFEVLPHPLGLPISVRGVFRMRVEDACRPMPYNEIRRRFAAAGDEMSAAVARADSAMGSVRERMKVRHSFTPSFAAAVAPLLAPHDLSMSGRELRNTFQELVDAERELWHMVDSPTEDLERTPSKSQRRA